MLNTYRTVSESDQDGLELFDKVNVLKLFFESNKMYECPYCDRLVLENENDKEFGWKFYKEEN